MTDRSVPSVSVATAESVDHVLGTKAGAVTRFAVSDFAIAAGLGAAGGSAGVGFTQSGTGAAGTVEAKLKETVSVKDAPFNAKGDGVTDDTAAIQAAVTAMAGIGGGRVVFPRGVYGISAATNTSGVQMASGVHLDLLGSKLLALSANSGSYRLVNFQGVSDCGISNGEVQGDRATNLGTPGQGHCIYVIAGCSNITIQNMKVRDAFGDGIYLGKTSTNLKVLGCTVTNNCRNNISVVNSSQVVIDGCDISSANGASPETGIDIEPNAGDGNSTDVIVSNCNIYSNAGDGVSYPSPNPPLVYFSEISNCNIHGNTGSGIKCSYVRNLNVRGCSIYSNGNQGVLDSAGTGISLNFVGNIVRDNTGAGFYGFASGTVISSNQIVNNSTWGIHWQNGTNTAFTNNAISMCGNDGIYQSIGYNGVISGNSITQIQNHGINLTGTNAGGETTKSRKMAVTGNSVSFVGLATDNTYSGINLDAYADTSTITGNVIVCGASGNLPLHAIFASDITVLAVNNHTVGGAKAGNSQISIGGIALPAYLDSPNVMSATYTGRLHFTATVFDMGGAGSPEGVQSAPVGSVYRRTDGGAGTTLYVKESGTGNTGWIAK